MKTKITLKDIANELGVSVSTVSKALHNNTRISKETRDKIQAFAKLLKYTPDARARSLRASHSNIIGVVIPEITNHFFTTVIKGIDYVTSQKGYQLIICLSNESYDREVENLNLLGSGSIDGLLVSIATETQKKGKYGHFVEAQKRELPMVLFDRVEETLNCDKVTADDFGGAYMATKAMYTSGCRNIAMLNFESHVTVGKERKEGYKKALQELKIEKEFSRVFEINEEKDFYSQVEKVFDLNPLPDGIFAVKEDFAAVAIKIALQKGIRIPEDLSLISFVNGFISEYSTPSITAVIQHGYDMGKLAAELLIDRIENKESEKSFETRVIATKLKYRDSTKNSIKLKAT